MAEASNIPPKTKHQRQSELRMIWRNKGAEGVQQIFLEKCPSAGKASAPEVPPAEMIQAILEQEYPLPPPTASEVKITKAIQETLALCQQSSAPQAMLEKLASELREGPDEWTDKEIAAVEDGVRRKLNNRFNRT